MRVLFCAEASFLDERPLTTPSLFLPHFPLDLSSTDPFFLPTHPTPPPPPFIFFVCSLFSLFFMLPSILGFLSPSSDLSHSLTVHTRAVGATAASSPRTQSWRTQTIVSTKSVSTFFSLLLHQTFSLFCLLLRSSNSWRVEKDGISACVNSFPGVFNFNSEYFYIEMNLKR